MEVASDLITLGTPHRGAPLEKLVGTAVRAMRPFAVTRPLAAFLDERSDGIKDLRTGGELAGPLPDGISQHFLAGVVTPSTSNPLGELFGDLMVRPHSAIGARTLDPDSVAVLGGLRHFDALHDQRVIGQVMEWLGRDARVGGGQR